MSIIHKKLITTEEYHKMGDAGMFLSDENVELIHGEYYKSDRKC